MSIKSVSNALDSRLDQLVDKPPIAWPNVSFEPELGSLWLRVSNLIGGSNLSTLQYSEEQRGVYQVDVFAPLDQGRATAEDQVDSIINLFTAERILISGLVSVRIGSIEPSVPRTEDAWFIISISINYSVHLQR